MSIQRVWFIFRREQNQKDKETTMLRQKNGRCHIVNCPEFWREMSYILNNDPYIYAIKPESGTSVHYQDITKVAYGNLHQYKEDPEYGIMHSGVRKKLKLTGSQTMKKTTCGIVKTVKARRELKLKSPPKKQKGIQIIDTVSQRNEDGLVNNIKYATFADLKAMEQRKNYTIKYWCQTRSLASNGKKTRIKDQCNE